MSSSHPFEVGTDLASIAAELPPAIGERVGRDTLLLYLFRSFG
jgi:tetrahydromethanopterin S-methyltransferase subunit G